MQNFKEHVCRVGNTQTLAGELHNHKQELADYKARVIVWILLGMALILSELLRAINVREILGL